MSLRLIAATTLALVAMALPLSAASAQGPATRPTAPQGPLDRLGAQLAQAGVKRCAPIVRAVAAFVTENSSAAFIVKPLGSRADVSPVMITVESAHANLGTTRYTTIMVVPTENCSGYYEQTIHWAATCPVVKTRNFANFPTPRPLLRNIQVSAASPTVSLQLMPAGQGCVSIKKEIFR